MGVSSSALDIVRHLYTVRPELCSMVTFGNAHVLLETRWGLGLSSGDLPEENVVRYSLIQYTGGMRPWLLVGTHHLLTDLHLGPQYCLAILGFKVSMLASYLRVAGFNRTYAVVLYISISLVTISQLIFTVLHAVSCSPVAMRESSQPSA